MLDVFLEEGRIIILNSFTKTVFGLGWSWWLIPLILVAIAGIVAIKVGCNIHESEWFWIGALCLVFALAAGVSIATNARVVETYEVYEVTIDNSVPFKDFNEVCEVIDQRGAIYTIRLKEAGN